MRVLQKTAVCVRRALPWKCLLDQTDVSKLLISVFATHMGSLLLFIYRVGKRVAVERKFSTGHEPNRRHSHGFRQFPSHTRSLYIYTHSLSLFRNIISPPALMVQNGRANGRCANGASRHLNRRYEHFQDDGFRVREQRLGMGLDRD